MRTSRSPRKFIKTSNILVFGRSRAVNRGATARPRRATKRHQLIDKTSYSSTKLALNRIVLEGDLMPSTHTGLAETRLTGQDFAETGSSTDWRSLPVVSDDECIALLAKEIGRAHV